ncbi:MAG: CopG family transcriptional regulator [Deltaproteobacteria bacterium HGW-Deltaproteobacteria-21]|nr:MAG: CopG family transcriptional regulator [Deltaproteobacteria bacterium HGW-Deltaproteobacteria-21]
MGFSTVSFAVKIGLDYVHTGVRITIRLDRDIVDWFRSKVEEQGGGNYQSMLNDALRTYMERQEQPIEEVVRRVVREELQAAQE